MLHVLQFCSKSAHGHGRRWTLAFSRTYARYTFISALMGVYSPPATTMAFLGFRAAVDKAEGRLKFAGEPKFSRRSILSGFPDGRISILAVHL